jgi:hypothetical protein
MTLIPANVEPITGEDLEPVKPVRRRTWTLKTGCQCCDKNGYIPGTPWHDASPRCESGGRNHCSCDVCH